MRREYHTHVAMETQFSIRLHPPSPRTNFPRGSFMQRMWNDEHRSQDRDVLDRDPGLRIDLWTTATITSAVSVSVIVFSSHTNRGFRGQATMILGWFHCGRAVRFASCRRQRDACLLHGAACRLEQRSLTFSGVNAPSAFPVCGGIIQPGHGPPRFEVSKSHTHKTLNEWISPSQWPLPTQDTNIHVLGGIRTHCPSNQCPQTYASRPPVSAFPTSESHG
jgi:hypothetical protein